MTKTSDKKNPQKILTVVVNDLFKLLSIKSKADVEVDKDNDALVVNIQADDESGLLIGSRGRTLQSIQSILGLILRQKLGEWKRVIVDVADWREKEEERLRDLAEKTAERVIATGEPQNLYNLTPSQRRLVHMALSENPKVKTESQGEGNDRYLVVSSSK